MVKFFLHMDTMSNFWLQNINIMRQVGGKWKNSLEFIPNITHTETKTEF